MSHTLSLTDGTTTIDLAETTDTGYHFVSYGAPRPNRILTRVGAYPFGNGERTVASGLADVVAEIVVNIVGSSANDLDAKVIALVALLEQAQRFEEQRIGAPVRLLFKRQGVTNTSYRVVTGVPLMPQPVDPEEINWLDGSAVMNEATVAFTLTLEPVAHAGAVTSLLSTSLTVEPGSDREASVVAPVGDMPGPLVLSLENTASGTTWSTAWMALIERNPINQIWNDTADVTAYQGRKDFSLTTNPTPSTLYSYSYVPTSELPLRSLVRCKVSSGTGSDVQLRFLLLLGTLQVVGPWVTFTGSGTNWTLMDLGTLRIPPDFMKRAGQVSTSPVSVYVQAHTTTGTATLGADYAQLLTYYSFMRMDALVPYQSVLHFDALLRNDTFYWPARTPQVYVTDSAGEATQQAERRGVLGQITPGRTTRLWISASSSTAHLWGATAGVAMSYLPSFALGLRGGV